MDKICQECIAKVKRYNTGVNDDKKVATTCVSYRDEMWHYHRLYDECPKIQHFIDEILQTYSYEVEKEFRG